LGDLKISGTGTSSGGVYNNVSISGSGEISSDIECDKFTISGSGHLGGSLKAKAITISGSAKIDGNAECKERLKISGSSKLGGDVKCGEFKVSGDSHISKSLSADHVYISGSVKISGDCNAEEFTTEGGFNIGGLLNAGVIDLHLHPWGSRAKEIGGERIYVKRSIYGRFLKAFIFHNKYSLETGTIEGDDIYLEGTKAQVVRGTNIKIGEGCEIDLVEYTGTFEQTSDTVVKENRKI